MIFYSLLLLLSLYFLTIHKPKNNQLESVFLCIVIAFLIGFKDMSVSSDIYSYLYRFELATNTSKVSTDDFEYGFSFFISFFKSIGFTFRGFLIVTAYLTTFFVSLFIFKFSKNVALSYFLYITIGIFLFSLSGLRQYLAIGIVLLAICKIEKHKYLSILLLFLASTVHYSSLICFCIPLLWYLSKLGLNRKQIFFVTILPVIALLIGKYLSYMIPSLEVVGRYKKYLNEDHDINALAYFGVPYVLFVYCSFLYWKMKKIDKRMMFCYLCGLMVAVLSGISLSLPMVSRLSYYFNTPMLVFIATSMTIMPKSFFLWVQKCGVILISILYYYISLRGNIMGIEDYKLCF